MTTIDRDINQRTLATYTRIERGDSVKADQLRKRAAECRKAGLHVAANKLEYEAKQCST